MERCIQCSRRANQPMAARWLPSEWAKHLIAREKNYAMGFAKANSADIMRAAWEDAGVAERDGFEIRCISDGT